MRRLLLMLVVAGLVATVMVCSSAPAVAQDDPDEDIEIFCGPLSEPGDADSEAYAGEEFACVAITPEEQG
jgi:hypothetical protein